MQDPGAVGELIEETWGILESLSAACASGQSAVAFRGGLKTIERHLHTIKGNAAAFALDDLSEAASRTLDWLRAAMRVTGSSLEKPEDLPPVVEFTRKLRQYLAILNPPEAPPKGFWSDTLVPAQQLAPGAQKPSTAARSATAPSRAPSEPDWDEEARRILSQAPVVNPQIDGIVWMAIQKLTGEAQPPRASVVPAEAPPKPAAPEPPQRASAPPQEIAQPAELPRDPAAVSVSDAAVHAYAIEAVVKAAWLRGLQEKCHSNSWLEAAFSEAAHVLGRFARWSAESRRAPLWSFLTQARGSGVAKGAGRQGEVAIDWTGRDTPVLPLAGQLIQALLDELIEAFGAKQTAVADGPPALKATVARADGCIQLTVSGLSGLDRVRPRLQLERIRQRIEKNGLAWTSRADAGSDVAFSLSIPDHLDGMEAQIVSAGGDRMAIPGHRVLTVATGGSGSCTARGDDGCIELDGEKLPSLDLCTGSPGEKAGDCVIVVGTDKGKRALLVDGLVGKQPVLLAAPEPGAQPSESFASCFALGDFEWMPFLWCSSRVFEKQESLVARP